MAEREKGHGNRVIWTYAPTLIKPRSRINVATSKRNSCKMGRKTELNSRFISF